MTLDRTISWAMAPIAALALMMAATEAKADNKASVFEACEAEMRAEFGEAEFEFSKLRRSEGNRNLAFGEMTLTDGSKRSVRCLFQRGKVRNVLFRNGNTSGRLEGGFWTGDRPPGAEFVPPAPEKTEQQEEQPQETAAVPSAVPSTDDAVTSASPDTEVDTQSDAARTDQTESPSDTNQTETSKTGQADSEATDTSAEAEATDEKDDDPGNFTPVFRRVQ
ncbi:MAG: hypothetical protein AB8B85_17180 [Paracoccaceae bacterium]